MMSLPHRPSGPDEDRDNPFKNIDGISLRALSEGMRRLIFAAPAVVLAACDAPSASSTAPASATPAHDAQLVAEFSVTNLAASRAFYEGLGFKTAHAEKTFLEMRWIDGHKLFLSESGGGSARPNKPTVNLRIGVSNVDEYWKRAQTMQARVVTPIGDRFYGERDFLIADPDGFGLRFASLLPAGHW